jgi:hypothetical protein
MFEPVRATGDLRVLHLHFARSCVWGFFGVSCILHAERVLLGDTLHFGVWFYMDLPSQKLRISLVHENFLRINIEICNRVLLPLELS